METGDIYPIGQQSFQVLRSRGALYVDKTRFVWNIVSSQSQNYFLARPRRFGKSLFLDTIKCFFEGRRELFRGLYIDSADWEWKKYPVLKLDLNMERYQDASDLDSVLNFQFRKWEEQYNVTVFDSSYSVRFANIIESAYRHTGMPVVILVDEYDKPLVSNLGNEQMFENFRSKLAAVYSNFKSASDHIRLVFITGVSRFSKLSIFSDLNNINDITFADQYADVCGISEAELHADLKDGISDLAAYNAVGYDEMAMMLKKNYDGYRFAVNGSDMYNPWSVLNAMSHKRISNYWSQTGMPTLIAEALKRDNADLQESFNSYCTLNDLQGYDLSDMNPQALLYQTGYLTIKEFDSQLEMCRLGIPNKEVEQGLFTVLLPYYASMRNGSGKSVVTEMINNFKVGRPERAMQELQAFFSGVSYKLKMENENNFHNAFFLLTSMLGLSTDAEVTTSQGRIDILIRTLRNIYVIELKYDGSAESALEQIKSRNYSRQFQSDHRNVYLIGVNFSSVTRCVEDWKIEEV